jgi:nitrogen fixation protein FixH
MRLNDGKRAMPERSAWRFFPWWVTGAMSVVIAVNVGMVYSALHTFPGHAGSDGFDLSNRYDAVIDRVQAQEALGWVVRAETDSSGHPVLKLSRSSGGPLSGARVQAVAERPLGATQTTRLAFREAAPGRYVGDAILAAPGQWDLMLTASSEGHDITTTRRVIVR